MITPEQIAEYKRLSAAATPGPWKVYELPHPIPNSTFVLTERRIGTAYDHPQLHAPAPVVTMSGTIGGRQQRVGIYPEDAAIIAHSRTFTDELVEAHEAHQQELATLRAEKAQKQLCIDDLRRQLTADAANVGATYDPFDVPTSSDSFRAKVTALRAEADRDRYKAEAERLAAMWEALRDFLSPDNTKLAHDDMPLETIEAKMRELEAKR